MSSSPARAAGDFALGNADALNDGRDDFDFLVGGWTGRHRRLHKILSGRSDDWYEFPSTMVMWKILGGMGNIDDNEFPTLGWRGMSLRLFDPEKCEWSIYWANNRTGQLMEPVFGRFENGEGRFFGVDEHEGRKVDVEYLWSHITASSCRWQQSFSLDGKEWEPNWIMEFTRQA